MKSDLADWLPETETAKRLQISWRTLMRRIEKGRAPERRMRPRPGKKPEPVYNPRDVEAMAPRPPAQVLRAGDPRLDRPEPHQPFAVDLTPFAVALERVLMARIPAPALPAPAPTAYMTAQEAGEILGLSEPLVKRLLANRVWPGLKDRGVWKVRRSDVANLDAVAGLAELRRIRQDLREMVEQRKAAGQ